MTLLNRIPLAIKILVSGSLVVAMVLHLKPEPKHNASAPPKQALPSVDVIQAYPQTRKISVRTQGTVTPRREVEIIAQVGGRVTQVHPNFAEGNFLEKDTPILKIDDRDYQLAVLKAQATVAEVEKELAVEKGRALQAKKEWRDLGSETANNLYLRKPQLAAAEANLIAAKADLSKAKLDLERTEVSLPFASRVETTLADIGQYVTPNSTIGRVYDTSVVEVRLPLTDKQLALLDLPLGKIQSKKVPSVKVSGVIGNRTHHWQGKITRTSASIDVQSRMLYAIAEIENPFTLSAETEAAPLVVGLYVEAEIEGKPIDNVITLPRTALFKRNQIYILNEFNTVAVKTVEVLHQDGDQVWISANIPKRTAIITGKQNYLAPDVKVAVQSELTLRQQIVNEMESEKKARNQFATAVNEG